MFLGLGFNFATAPKSIPKEDIMARTEEVASSMKHNEGQQLREEVKRSLDRTEDPTHTLNKCEQGAIKSLQLVQGLVILPLTKALPLWS